jgi:hypothetical protein
MWDAYRGAIHEECIYTHDEWTHLALVAFGRKELTPKSKIAFCATTLVRRLGRLAVATI